MHIASFLGWIALAAALAGVGYAAFAYYALGSFARGRAHAPSRLPPVTLLKPLHGAEPRLLEDLESFFTQDYSAALQIVFGVRDPNDPAVAIVEALMARHPEVSVALVCGGFGPASNPKIANLISMLPRAEHEVLILSDSDIRVPAHWLKSVIGALEQPGVGAVTCCYVGEAGGNIWSRMSAMGIDYQFLPSVAAGVAMGLAKPCFGSTIAMRRADFNAIGGFEAFAGQLADDYEIGQAIRGRGLAVALPPVVVSHSCTEETASQLFQHELRWARTIFGIEPLSYASIVTHMVPLAFVGTLLLGFSRASLLVLAMALLARLLVKRRVDSLFDRRGLSAWLLPARDMLSFAVFVAALFASRVEWRGQRYQLNAAGALLPD